VTILTCAVSALSDLTNAYLLHITLRIMAIIIVDSINQLIFVMETRFIFFEVESECLEMI
jgi:hypothetical protein